MHDVSSAVAEAHRCVTERGAVAIIGTPNPVKGQHLHDEACEPLSVEHEELNVSGVLSSVTARRSGKGGGAVRVGANLRIRRSLHNSQSHERNLSPALLRLRLVVLV